MSFIKLMEILEEMITKARKKKMWGKIQIEFRDGQILFIDQNETRKIHLPAQE